jgi:hypothetical protein
MKPQVFLAAAALLVVHCGDSSSPTQSTQHSSERIVFTSNRFGNFDVFAVDADGSDLTRPTQEEADETAPSWLPDGSQPSSLYEVDWLTYHHDWNPSVIVWP